MSRLEVREREQLVKTVILCSVVGLLMALAVATVLVYEKAPVDRHQTAAIPNDLEPPHAETTTERPRK